MKDAKANLQDILNIPDCFVDCTVTSDGVFLAQASGDCGFNHFLGKPSFHQGPGKERSQSVWKKLSFREKRALVRLAPRYGLSLREVLR